jgi:hypothetical protein
MSSGPSAHEEVGPSIRFDLERGLMPNSPVSPMRGEFKGKDVDAVGILSRPGTPPPQRGRSRSASRVRKERSDGREGEEEMRDRGETWVEGNDTVIESEDGERVRVVHGDRR